MLTHSLTRTAHSLAHSQCSLTLCSLIGLLARSLCRGKVRPYLIMRRLSHVSSHLAPPFYPLLPADLRLSLLLPLFGRKSFEGEVGSGGQTATRGVDRRFRGFRRGFQEFRRRFRRHDGTESKFRSEHVLRLTGYGAQSVKRVKEEMYRH